MFRRVAEFQKRCAEWFERRAANANWRQFAQIILVGGPAALLLSFAVIVSVDPYKVLPQSFLRKPEIPESLQRYFYPMLLRTRTFDSFAFGNSTAGLIDPKALNSELGGNFASLWLGDGRAWEQLELLRLVHRYVPAPRQLMFGFDGVWCVESLNRAQREIDRFPMWVYSDPSWSNVTRLFNQSAFWHALKNIQMVIFNTPPVIRDDGLFIFTPAETGFDLRKTRIALYGTPDPPALHSSPAPVTIPRQVSDAWKFPALDELEQLLKSFPGTTRVHFVGMPVHITAQPVPGSETAERERVCKDRANQIAHRHGGVFADFRIASSVTQDDEKYWDPLHYRLPIARRLERAIGSAIREGKSDPNGFWRILPEPES